METDSTQVTGSPISARGPRRGAVLGERYEIVDALDGDALGLTYKALDQESEAHVLFRMPAPGALGEKDARSLVTRLSPLVGIGGRTLARIRDVDREGALVFVVEPWPHGTTFRAILEGRRNKGTVFSTVELLPVIASLAEATMAIPSPWFHGDLRAHRVYVHADGVRITGGFALSVLPGDAIVDALTDDVGLRRQFAPEVGDGLAGPPSDRWAVAALAWEALTGSAPEPGPKSAPPALGDLGKILLRYLDPDPTLRPPTLELLVSTLAKHAKTPVPKLSPEPFSVEVEAPSDDRTQQLDPNDLVPSKPPPAPNDTAKMQALVLTDAPTVKDKDERDLSDIDPALLKAAALNRKMSASGTFKLDAKELEPVTGQKKQLPGGRAPDSGELDPRLVRAALGIDEGTDPAAEASQPRPGRGKRPSSTTQELDMLDLEAVPPSKKAAVAQVVQQKVAPKAASPAPKAAPMPSAKSIPPARAMPAPKPAPAPSAGPPVQPKPMPMAQPAVQPAVQPAPMPPVQPAVQAAPMPMVQPALRPMPAVEPVLHAPIATAPPAGVPAPRAFVEQPPTRLDRPGGRERGNGTMIIAIAIGVAVTILVLAFWYRSAQQEAAHQRQIDERVRQIQGQ